MTAQTGRRPGGAVANRMNGFSATASMASATSYSSFVPSRHVEKTIYLQILTKDALRPHRLQSAFKICSRSFVVRRTRVEHIGSKKHPRATRDRVRERQAAQELNTTLKFHGGVAQIKRNSTGPSAGRVTMRQ